MKSDMESKPKFSDVILAIFFGIIIGFMVTSWWFTDAITEVCISNGYAEYNKTTSKFQFIDLKKRYKIETNQSCI